MVFIETGRRDIYAGVRLSRIWEQMDTRIWKYSNSGLIVKTSGHSWSHLSPSCDRWLYFPDFRSNFVSEDKIFGIQKNWPKSSRSLIFVLISCVHFALRKAIVMASCQLYYFVWSSVVSGIFRLTKTIRRKQEAARLSYKGNTTTWSPRNIVVKPSYYSTMVSRWDHCVGEDSQILVDIMLVARVMEQPNLSCSCLAHMGI